MFYDAYAFNCGNNPDINDPDKSLSKWYTNGFDEVTDINNGLSKVLDMTVMFHGTSQFMNNISNWRISNNVIHAWMFDGSKLAHPDYQTYQPKFFYE